MAEQTKKPKTDRRKILLLVGVALAAFVIYRRLASSSSTALGTATATDPTATTDPTSAATDPSATSAAFDSIQAQLDTFGSEIDALYATGGPTSSLTPTTTGSTTAPPPDTTPATSDTAPMTVQAPAPVSTPQAVVTRPAAHPAAVVVPTATILQPAVATPNRQAVFPATPATRKPVAAKAKANKTGASANKTQGVFAIH